MQLSLDTISDWITWQYPSSTQSEQQVQADKLRQKALADPEVLKLSFLAQDSMGAIIASLSLHRFQPGVLSFANPRALADVLPETLLQLISEALTYSRSIHHRLQGRLSENEQLQAVLAQLSELDGHLSHKRLEFSAPLHILPLETDSPLNWQALEPEGAYSLEQAAEILTAAGQGDPDWHKDDDALELLKAYLSDEALSTGPECVQIAQLQDQPIGIVVAQVNPSNGWSRITYMALLPAFRQQKWGKWLHRHGFAMMREQGGQTYHGGTVQGNHAMTALFYSQGCQLDRVLQEWHWD